MRPLVIGNPTREEVLFSSFFSIASKNESEKTSFQLNFRKPSFERIPLSEHIEGSLNCQPAPSNLYLLFMLLQSFRILSDPTLLHNTGKNQPYYGYMDPISVCRLYTRLQSERYHR